MPTMPNITVTELMSQLGRPDAPLVIDICLDPDFADDPYLVPGAIRHAHTDVAGLIAKLNGRQAVILCQKGRKLSQGLAAWLHTEGIDARYLVGGMYAWRDHAGTVRIPAAALPPSSGTAGLWVTAARPNIDQLARLWLLHRFIDRNARVLFVESDEVDAVAERFGAASLDSFMTPLAASPDKCRFSRMLDHFELGHAALQDFARSVDAQAGYDVTAGLHAILAGSADAGTCDQVRMTSALLIFDALFRALRDRSQSGAAA